MPLELVAQLPDGDNPVGMTLFKGRLLIACANGKIWEYERTTEGQSLKLLKFDLSGMKSDLDFHY